MEEKLSRQVFRYHAIPQREKRALVNKYNSVNEFEKFVLRLYEENPDENFWHDPTFYKLESLYQNPNISVEFILNHPNIFNQNPRFLFTNPNYVEYAQDHGIDITNMYDSFEGCGNSELPLYKGVFDRIPQENIPFFISRNRYINLKFLIEEKVDEEHHQELVFNPNTSRSDIYELYRPSEFTVPVWAIHNSNLSARDIYDLGINKYENPNISRDDYFILTSLDPRGEDKFVYNPNLILTDIMENFSGDFIQFFAKSPMLYEYDVFGDENSLATMTRNDRLLFRYWLSNPNVDFEKFNITHREFLLDEMGIGKWLGPYDPVKFKELYLMDEENKSAYRTLTRLPSYKNIEGIEYLPLDIRGHIGKFLGVPHDSRNYNVEPLRELKRHGSPVRESRGSPVRESRGSPVRESRGSPVRESRRGSPVRESRGSPRNPRRSPFRK